jgi:nitrite reductase/ring-hydroxylating ferredoxin subunit
VLGPIEEIPEGKGKEYLFGLGKSAFSMFVIRRGCEVWGYLNLCPYFSLPLNHRAGEFMNEDGSLIRCSMHCVGFRIEDGECVAGAATGCALDPVPSHVDPFDQVAIGPAAVSWAKREDSRGRGSRHRIRRADIGARQRRGIGLGRWADIVVVGGGGGGLPSTLSAR